LRAIPIIIILTLTYVKHAFAFDAGEHAKIGDLAFSQMQLPISNEFHNLEVDIAFSYGQLVALSGDMYESLEEIALNDPKILNGFFERNRNSLKQCIDREIHSIEHSTEYSGCNDMRLASKKLKYLTLAHDNYSHFAWHNVKYYVQYHEKALWFAQLAFWKCTKEQIQKNAVDCQDKQSKIDKLVAQSDYRNRLKSKYRKFPKLFPRKAFSKDYLKALPKDKLITLAVFSNAFADHFLTDMFSAGHLRVPRSQVDTFVESHGEKDITYKQKKRKQGTAISGALTQLLHNTDGYIKGISVTNSLKHQFTIRSDKQLFSAVNMLELSQEAPALQQVVYPVNAVKASLNEVFTVITTGQNPAEDSAFAALLHAPIIDFEKAQTLHENLLEVIAENGAIKKIVNQMTSQMSLIFKGSLLLDDIDYADYLQDFITALPLMMKAMREQIKTESAQKNYSKRVPEPLMKGLLIIN